MHAPARSALENGKRFVLAIMCRTGVSAVLVARYIALEDRTLRTLGEMAGERGCASGGLTRLLACGSNDGKPLANIGVRSESGERNAAADSHAAANVTFNDGRSVRSARSHVYLVIAERRHNMSVRP